MPKFLEILKAQRRQRDSTADMTLVLHMTDLG